MQTTRQLLDSVLTDDQVIGFYIRKTLHVFSATASD